MLDSEEPFYYSGLLSTPPLLATSSTQNLSLMHGGVPSRETDHERPACRQILAPVNHPVAAAWHDANGSLRTQVLRALDDCHWNAIDWFRVGIGRDTPFYDTFELTMMVSVPPAQISRAQASVAAFRCKAALEAAGFQDIHCEIRESSVFLLAESVESSKSGVQRLKKPHTRDAPSANSFCSMIGDEIAMLSRPGVTATKGPYLQVRCSGKKYSVVLSCRHLLETTQETNVDIELWSGDATTSSSDYRPRDALHVIQWGEAKIKELEETNDCFYQHCRPESRPGREPTSDKLAWAEKVQAIYEERAAFMANICKPNARIFGSVLFSPAIRVSSLAFGANNRWLMDWMLVGLDASRHEEDISQIKNTLYLVEGEDSTKKSFSLVDNLQFSSRESARLYMYSSKDSLVPSVEIEEHAVAARSMGYRVSLCLFHDSAHVQHMRTHPDEY